MTDDLSREEFELLARVARRYHIDGLTQAAIGREFGLSRPTVQRLLDRARARGVVDVHVEAPPWLHLDLESRLQQAFNLTAAIVAGGSGDPHAQRQSVARAAARFLERRVEDGSIVAVSHGRDTAELARFFRPARRIESTFVSAMGGAPSMEWPTNPNEIGRALADRGGGRAVSLYAPVYVASAGMRDQLLAEESVAEPLRLARRAAIAVVGIGGVDDDCTMVRSGCFSLEELARLRELGAVGDVLGNYVDAAGRPIEAPGMNRVVGLSIEELRGIATVIAVVSEAEKPQAILGVLRAGVIGVLVVDEHNARMVLQLAGNSGPATQAASSDVPGGP